MKGNKKPGYYRHEKALCESLKIGRGTRVWAFAHILPGAVLGKNCNICDGVFIENDVVIGDGVTVKCGVQLWDGMRVEDDVFIGPNASFANDKFPRSRKYPDKFLSTIIRKGASIGANATILPGVEIGTGAMIGAGAVVTMNVPPHAVVAGNPAVIIRYIDTKKKKSFKKTEKTDAKDKLLYNMKKISDMRGDLTVGEFASDMPFVPKRYFIVYDVPSEKVRGQHAHKKCRQFLVCVKGSVKVAVDDGKTRSEYLLDSPEKGLFIPPMAWGAQYAYEKNTVLLVFASHPYDNEDYIRDYNEWLEKVRK